LVNTDQPRWVFREQNPNAVSLLCRRPSYPAGRWRCVRELPEEHNYLAGIDLKVSAVLAFGQRDADLRRIIQFSLAIKKLATESMILYRIGTPESCVQRIRHLEPQSSEIKRLPLLHPPRRPYHLRPTRHPRRSLHPRPIPSRQ